MNVSLQVKLADFGLAKRITQKDYDCLSIEEEGERKAVAMLGYSLNVYCVFT